jgi:hypothetical protein
VILVAVPQQRDELSLQSHLLLSTPLEPFWVSGCDGKMRVEEQISFIRKMSSLSCVMFLIR